MEKMMAEPESVEEQLELLGCARGGLLEKTSWRNNLGRQGGFFGDPSWYNLQLTYRLPLAQPMQQALLRALPPLGPDDVVCDLCCGTGTLAQSVLLAYRNIGKYVCIDSNPAALAMAKQSLNCYMTPTSVSFLEHTYDCTGGPLPLPPSTTSYTCIIASLALHVIIGHDTKYSEAVTRYHGLLMGLWASVGAGGHILVGDHVGGLPVFVLLQVMHLCGFVEVDVAWRERDFFVCGGRKPV